MQLKKRRGPQNNRRMGRLWPVIMVAAAACARGAPPSLGRSALTAGPRPLLCRTRASASAIEPFRRTDRVSLNKLSSPESLDANRDGVLDAGEFHRLEAEVMGDGRFDEEDFLRLLR